MTLKIYIGNTPVEKIFLGASQLPKVALGNLEFLPKTNSLDSNIIALFTGGKQGVFYDPSDKSTLFQDVAGTIPVTKDGDPVALMRDKSGNGNHATQTVSTSRPVYKTDGILHWLTFDGVDDWFYILSMNFLGGNIVSSASLRPMETTQSNKSLLSQWGSRKSLLWYLSTNAVKIFTIREELVQITGIPNGVDMVISARNTQVDNFKGSRVNGIESTNSRLFDPATSSAPATAMLGSAEGYLQRFSGRLYGIAAVFDDSAVEFMEDIDLYMASKAGVTL